MKYLEKKTRNKIDMSEENRSRQLIALIVFLVIGGIIVYSIYTGVLTIAVVKGRSMLPLLREGDIVFIVKTRPENIHVEMSLSTKNQVVA